MSQTLACLRYFLIGGAIILGICGIIESICAGYFMYQLYEYSVLTPNDVCGPTIMLLASGLIMSLIAWCAWQFITFAETGQIIIFSLALTILTILNTSAGIWALVRHEQMDVLPRTQLEQVFDLAVSDDKSLWDAMHSKLHCCGVNGAEDYRGQDAIPWSCCNTETPESSSGACTLYARGCHHVVINRTRSTLLHIFLLALCTVLLQVCFIMCMTCYARACRDRAKRNKDVRIATQALTQESKRRETSERFLNA
nr:23 kDa integral membrane protein-like isoform X1 [Megalopta genalis]